MFCLNLRKDSWFRKLRKQCIKPFFWDTLYAFAFKKRRNWFLCKKEKMSISFALYSLWIKRRFETIFNLPLVLWFNLVTSFGLTWTIHCHYNFLALNIYLFTVFSRSAWRLDLFYAGAIIHNSWLSGIAVLHCIVIIRGIKMLYVRGILWEGAPISFLINII